MHIKDYYEFTMSFGGNKWDVLPYAATRREPVQYVPLGCCTSYIEENEIIDENDPTETVRSSLLSLSKRKRVS